MKVVSKVAFLTFARFNRWQDEVYFCVKWKGYHEKHNEWRPKDDINAEELLEEFLEERRKKIPKPGGVTVMCGGTPCKGFRYFLLLPKY